jgi:hypothetical protein
MPDYQQDMQVFLAPEVAPKWGRSGISLFKLYCKDTEKR